MILQLDPPLPMDTVRGPGLAHFMIDYGPETHLMWVVFMDADGACWTVPNPEVRMQPNWSMQRRPGRRPFEGPSPIAAPVTMPAAGPVTGPVTGPPSADPSLAALNGHVGANGAGPTSSMNGSRPNGRGGADGTPRYDAAPAT